jgi:ABC-2 type transport system permease protein
MIAMAWLSAAIGLLARSPEAANGFTFVVMFIPYASSAFVPVGTMPSWLQGFAAHQPITALAAAVGASGVLFGRRWHGRYSPGILGWAFAALAAMLGRQCTCPSPLMS